MAALVAQEKFIEGAVDQWWVKSNSVRILVTGKTGTGKSSLVNSVLGKQVAVVGQTLNPQTSEVSSFETKIKGIKVIVWDSPGLQDGLENEKLYLEDIKKKCSDKIDLLLYCIAMDSPRFFTGSRDIESMVKLTDALGKGIWKNAVVVLTCANRFITGKQSTMVPSDDIDEKFKPVFYKRLKEWQFHIMKCLQEDLRLPIETTAILPILPTGVSGKPLLLKGFQPWLSNFWMESVLVTKSEAQPALIKMNLHRLINASDIRSEREFAELLKKESIIINDKAREVGKLVKADEAAKAAGELCGAKASVAHIMEHIFRRDPILMLLDIAVSINPEIIIPLVLCMDLCD